MKSIKLIKKQIIILFIFSILASITAIVHGIFFDLEFSAIKRLTIEGLILTLIIIFPAILFLEYIFDINDKQEIDSINRRLTKLERKLKWNT